jgi:hypothetical protein
VAALLPVSAAPGEAVWECRGCGRQDSRQAVLEVVRRLDIELGAFAYSRDPPDWEELLARCSAIGSK